MRLLRRSLLLLLALTAAAQQPRGAADLKLSLDRLRTPGSVLMIAAHPDDENTALLAYFARGRNLRTAYLSLTRGEGGQNLIGPEQGAYLGVIRTQELLAARRLDGAEQYFSRAIDFGFSKTAEETLKKWGREEVLSDVVWTIRRYQPDIIVLRFSGTPRDGHGHHQSSAILGKEAFEAAADPARFPEQLTFVKPWKAARVLHNVSSFTREMERAAAVLPGRIEVDTGTLNPVLGYSYSEIAGLSRSMHRSQAMGSAERKGAMPNYMTVVAGAPAAKDPFDGIDTTWNRVPGGAAVAETLNRAADAFDVSDPSKMLPALLDARARIAAIDHPVAKRKLVEADELIAEAAGLWLDAAASRHTFSPGSEGKLTVTALRRSPNAAAKLIGVEWEGVKPAGDNISPADLAYNKPMRSELPYRIAPGTPSTAPYWLARPAKGALYDVREPALRGLAVGPPLSTARFRIAIGGAEITIERPVIYRWVDPVRGELTRPVAVAPPVAVSFTSHSVLFPDAAPKKIEVEIRAVAVKCSGEVSLDLPAGWKAEPSSRPFSLEREGELAAVSFDVTPPKQNITADLRAVARVNGAEIRTGVDVIDYEHIPPQTLFPPAQAALVRADVKLLSKRIGYVMGAGDEAPDALRQLGAEVTPLLPSDLARGDLTRFDAIITGVRAFNTRPDLRANMQRLLDYIKRGGTMVVQYNVLGGFAGAGESRTLDNIGPYPLRVGRDRVSVEDAPMTPVHPDHALLQTPNRITEADYQGWVQERGLYFASEFDPRYEPIWTMRDPNEPVRRGGTLYTRYGKGVYIFTPLSWFRQLPAGVPGAYRLFANFLSAGKVIQ